MGIRVRSFAKKTRISKSAVSNALVMAGICFSEYDVPGCHQSGKNRGDLLSVSWYPNSRRGPKKTRFSFRWGFSSESALSMLNMRGPLVRP